MEKSDLYLRSMLKLLVSELQVFYPYIFCLEDYSVFSSVILMVRVLNNHSYCLEIC